MRLLDKLVQLVVVISGAALCVLVGITGWQVYGRYVLNDTPTWAERLALLLILVVALPLAAIGLRENNHLGLRVFADRLPKTAQYALEIINTIVLLVFGAAMAFYSMRLVNGTWNRDIPLLGVPQAFQYLPLVVCGILIVIFMIEKLWMLLLQRKRDT
jgi:TRAP-type C4-dicarboxylate transport system permease small subunit